jgi:Domain of unknown function (DUF4383)
MSVLHPKRASHPIHTVHRVGALLLGGFLLAFGIVGLTRTTEFMSTFGTSVFGLSTNGLLATLSLLVGLLLLGAAARGGPMASTVLIGVGVLFLLSGLVNVITIGTSMNILAFAPANVIFSLVVGAALLFVGAYGRFTGRLPLDSPYSDLQRTSVEPDVRSYGSVDREMADAERAVAQHVATPEQARRVRAAAIFRTQEDRRAAFHNTL